jgi:hypothetical protein
VKRLSKILPLLTFAGLVLCSSRLSAQVTSTVNITVTVIPGPEMDFSPLKSQENSFVTAGSLQPSGAGITFRSSGNVLVRFKDNKSGRSTVFDFQQPGVKTFTFKEMKDVSSVEVLYLGS